MSQRVGLIALLLVGCASAPLGDDWEALASAAKDERALAALADLFEGGREGREVEHVGLDEIHYLTSEGAARLRWEDVDSVQAESVAELPGRPETIRLYLRQGSDSEQEALDLQDPLPAVSGLVQRYLVLRERPRFSRLRLLAALDHLRSRRARRLASQLAGAAPVQSRTVTAAPSPEEHLSALGVKLRELKEWHEAGLITQEEYDLKRRELLEGL